MTTAEKELLSKALKLKPKDKFLFVEALVESLDKPDEYIEKIWLVEAEKRLKQHRENSSRGVPAEEVVGDKKMKLEDIEGIAQLTTEEKVLFVEELWDSIVTNVERLDIPQCHIAELEKRCFKYQSNPGKLLSIEELKYRIDKKK